MEKKDGLFDWKHLRLWRLSSAAVTTAAGVVVVFILASFGEAYRYNQLAQSQFQTTLFGLFSRQPIYILDVALQMARVVVQGLVYYLVLKGVALGLNMIVETDLNYRDRQHEEGVK